jgi:hypothetical protein
MAVALYKFKTGNEPGLGALEKLVDMRLLPAIPINPLTDLPFSKEDMQAPPAAKGAAIPPAAAMLQQPS